jgi:hypothetical protein
MRAFVRAWELRKGWRLWIALVVGTLMALACANGAAAYSTFKTVYGFCSSADGQCHDGGDPKNQLLIDQQGNLYSGPTAGGKIGVGTVLSVSPPKKWKVLHSFCGYPATCPHGDEGEGSSSLIRDASGNLYGVTSGADHNDAEYGILFKISVNDGNSAFSVKHKFCQKGGSYCTDGAFPINDGLVYAGQGTGAPWDGVSPLYGVTLQGGVPGGGVIFQVVPNDSGWKYTVIHNFVGNTLANGLIADSAGHLYGSLQNGGKYALGSLYKLVQNPDGSWKQTNLHNFCQRCGRFPSGRLFLDKSHNLFGTAILGGSTPYCTQGDGCGVAFELTQNGQYKEIYDFCSLPGCADGLQPEAGLTMDSAGNLLGASVIGGVAANCPYPDNELGCGTVFELSQNAGVWSGAPLYSFCSEAGCTDGEYPWSPLTLDSAGNIFGTTYIYGPHGVGGTIFEILH